MREEKGLSSQTRQKIEAQIAALRRQAPHDSSDLEFESHLQLIRDLEALLKRKA